MRCWDWSCPSAADSGATPRLKPVCGRLRSERGLRDLEIEIRRCVSVGVKRSKKAGVRRPPKKISLSPACRAAGRSVRPFPNVTVVKMVDFGYTLPSAISENAVCAAPPPQQFKAAPPGNLTREHRTGPYPSLPAGFRPHGSLNRIGSRVSASPAGDALQAPVSTAPESHPNTSTRASLASSRVR